MSGAWVFRGTRVPIAALFENLEFGARLEEFLDWFPGVAREQAEGGARARRAIAALAIPHLPLDPLDRLADLFDRERLGIGGTAFGIEGSSVERVSLRAEMA